MTNDGTGAPHVVASEAALRALYPEVSGLAKLKSLPALDVHSRAFLARSPFLILGTQGPSGRADVSPRGDAPGFVLVLDDRTLAIPDRPGNNRLDSLSNIVADPSVGLLCLIPGYEETLRINGRAHLSTDPDLLERMAVNGRLPRLAVVVRIEEVFLHCAKAFRRSRLWDPEARQDRSEMPSLSKMILDQTTGAPDGEEMARLDAGLEEAYARSMY
ncbi:pyridoxamine 5'-phosphate oxidase family protein [Wenxinia marina]|uniref:PPOX class probable FMN-dependent enzyme family n=1 Tax=Wenxinia marina DSM 24838 TaxID=1123501 RepID=A0A0D0Q878_9RHOB|nr:pyridoxamine 5'-phosphate oxidase family protein [Wenxinia marina]KIQ68612.1 PPOX class probable FMN-dependent enzyme family [Wenxinia marina DSM 24838]GGL67281.1 hypothetical protein GCM10011392_22260 [Wenxinia marina]